MANKSYHKWEDETVHKHMKFQNLIPCLSVPNHYLIAARDLKLEVFLEQLSDSETNQDGGYRLTYIEQLFMGTATLSYSVLDGDDIMIPISGHTVHG